MSSVIVRRYDDGDSLNVRYGDAESEESDDDGEVFPGAYQVNRVDHQTSRVTEQRVAPQPKGQELNSSDHFQVPPAREEEKAPITDSQQTENESQLTEDSFKNEIKTRRRRTRRMVIGITGILVCFVALSAGLVLGTRNGGQKTLDVPSSAPTRLMEFNGDEIKDLFERRSPLTSFDDPSSPQTLALEWLVADSYTQMMVAAGQVYGDRVVQRFALATFWFSTRGDNWTAGANWLEPVSDCGWDNIECDEGSNTRVARIHLHENELIGTIPREVSLLTSLEVLDLAENKLSGSIPSELLDELPNLRVLILHANSLTGTTPTLSQPLKSKLEILDVANNSLTGTISGLDQHPKLQTLTIGSNGFTGTIPPTISALSQLEVLRIEECTFTGTIPTELFTLTLLQELTLADARALNSGPLPPAIGNLSKLTSLQLDYLRLKGPLPSTLGLLTELKLLSVAHNALTGTFPSEIGSMTALNYLYINSNRLEGILPSEIGSMAALNYLHVSNNRLEGILPSEIGLLTDLMLFVGFNNNLSGPLVPLEDLAQLSELHIFGNPSLTGTISSSMCARMTPTIDCDGAISCDCCNKEDLTPCCR